MSEKLPDGLRRCQTCDGTGYDPKKKGWTCPTCRGACTQRKT